MSTIPARQLAAIVAERVDRMNRDMTDAQRAFATIGRNLAPAIIALETRNDGWPMRRGEGGSSSGVSDPVAAMVATMDRFIAGDDQIKILWSRTMAGMVTLADLLAKMAAMAPQVAPEATRPALCSAGVHLAGYESWGKRDASGALLACDEVPDMNPETGQTRRSGLCTGCYYRSYKWMRDHGSNMASR
jgi:hypothetical protein